MILLALCDVCEKQVDGDGIFEHCDGIQRCEKCKIEEEIRAAEKRYNYQKQMMELWNEKAYTEHCGIDELKVKLNDLN